MTPVRAHSQPAEELAFGLVARLRADGHLSNVLTHLSAGKWSAVEEAIVAILRPRAATGRLSGLARNILELLCDDRGVTGRLMRPFFFAQIAQLAGKTQAVRLEHRIRRLRARMGSVDGSVAAPARRKPSSGRSAFQSHVRANLPSPAPRPARNASDARP
jgi:hypothetical protein